MRHVAVVILCNLCVSSYRFAPRCINKVHTLRKVNLQRYPIYSRQVSTDIERSEYLQAILLFGRLADQLGIGNTKYIPDLELPFSLWISLPLSRRLKNDYSPWKVLFDENEQISREKFHEMIREMPFKYPRGNETSPVELPRLVLDKFPGLNLADIKNDGSSRENLNKFLKEIQLEASTVDKFFDMVLEYGCSGDTAKDIITAKDFEMCMLKWASKDPETEGDPVVEWSVFWENVRSMPAA
mmetsp:Transcript_15255/g.23095  ORF Transcript_15255/g.23095 Transcript_15255/m.23095 type:complete len:241 (-) Transcript_15255:76-798(-)